MAWWSAGRATPGRSRAAAILLTAAAVLAPACSDEDAPDAEVPTTTGVADSSSSTSASADPTPTDQTLGTVADTVPGVGEVAEPVGLDQVAEFGNGVTARVVAIEPVSAEAQLPGERSGPGLAVTIEVANGTRAPIDLGTTTVDLVLPTDRSATAITNPDEPGFTGQLAAGAQATARYTYLVDPAERGRVAIKIKYSADTPTVVLAGDASDV